jgi:4-amino-4-deoxy-L-arabinose transferase-like glycosyltransferase
MSRKRGSFYLWIVPLACLLLAFSLRVWKLDARPLWWDEGLTLTFSRLSPLANAQFAVKTAEPNPPVYRWTVGGLTALTGTNVFTTRLVSVYTSTFAAAIFFALVNRGFGRIAASWSLLLFATAPMQIYYAQEAKGYAFTTAFVLLSVLIWVKLQSYLERGSPPTSNGKYWGLWAFFAVCVGFAIGANYLAIIAYVVLVLFSLFMSICAYYNGVNIRSLLMQWAFLLTSLAIGVLLLFPFMLWTLTGTMTGLSETSAGLVRYYPVHFAGIFINTFGSGVRSIGLVGIILTLLFLCLSALGFYWAYKSRRQIPAWFTLAWIITPLFLGYIFHLFYPWFFPRFLLYAQVGLLALAGAGLASLSTVTNYKNTIRKSWISWSVALVALYLSGYALVTHYDAPSTNSEDYIWPDLFALLREYLRPNDLVIVSYPWMPGYMYAYIPSSEVPEWELGFFDQPRIDEQMGTLLENNDRLWEIDYLIDPFNPPVDSVHWLQGRTALAFTRQAGPGTLSLFIDGRRLTPDKGVEAKEVRFENGIIASWKPEAYEAEPGDFAGVQINWRPEDSLDSRLVRFLHLQNMDGQLMAQVDREPVMGSSPTFEWLPGEEYLDPMALLLPSDLPAGEYTLWAGLYDRDTLQRIRLESGADSVNVGTVSVK